MRFVFALVAMLAAQPVWADGARLDALFEALADEQATGWEAVEAEIWDEWSRSGSAAMDLLLERGRAAMADEDYPAAIEHFSALVENAPDFAEGWNGRATAYFQAGLLGPALSDIARTLALEPRHFGALSGLGLIHEESGDLENALGAYAAARAIHPARADLREAVERIEAALLGKRI